MHCMLYRYNREEYLKKILISLFPSSCNSNSDNKSNISYIDASVRNSVFRVKTWLASNTESKIVLSVLRWGNCMSVLCTVYNILCTVYCVLFTVYCALCTVHSILCTVYCVQYTVHCALCTVWVSLLSIGEWTMWMRSVYLSTWTHSHLNHSHTHTQTMKYHTLTQIAYRKQS